MSDYSNCVAGCKHFTGGEVHHHKDCPNYPESMSRSFDEMKAELKKYKKEKRKPLPDGTLPLTAEELVKFSELIRPHELVKKDVCKIFFKNGALAFKYLTNEAVTDNRTDYLINIKAILWLAERFELEDKCK